MPGHSQAHESLASLEDLLVQQFRALQTLVALTKEERRLISKNDAFSLMKVVEQKENVLDQLNQIDSNLRNQVREAAGALDISLKNDALNELLPHLDAGLSDRLYRLQEGISMLALQARDLNSGNQALISDSMGWVGTAQAYLINLCQAKLDVDRF